MVVGAIVGGAAAGLLGSLLGGSGQKRIETRVASPTINESFSSISSPQFTNLDINAPTISVISDSPNSSIKASPRTSATQSPSQAVALIPTQSGGEIQAPSSSGGLDSLVPIALIAVGGFVAFEFLGKDKKKNGK